MDPDTTTPPTRCHECFNFVQYCSCPKDDIDRAYERLVIGQNHPVFRSPIAMWATRYSRTDLYETLFGKRTDPVLFDDQVKLPDHVHPEVMPGTMEETTEFEDFEEWADEWLDG